MGKKVVGLDRPIRIRFSDGQEVIVIISDIKEKRFSHSIFTIRVNAPLAQAILGKSVGDISEFPVEGDRNRIKILEIMEK